jgi:hypothetical protein
VQQRRGTGPRLPREGAAVPTLFEVEVVIRIGNTDPADERGLNAFARPVGEVQVADAFRSQQPFVSRTGGDIDKLRLDVGRNDAKSLNRVDDE